MKREHSSAGSEHLPYKQGVIGSNPITPTEKLRNGLDVSSEFFLLETKFSTICFHF